MINHALQPFLHDQTRPQRFYPHIQGQEQQAHAALQENLSYSHQFGGPRTFDHNTRSNFHQGGNLPWTGREMSSVQNFHYGVLNHENFSNQDPRFCYQNKWQQHPNLNQGHGGAGHSQYYSHQNTMYTNPYPHPHPHPNPQYQGIQIPQRVQNQ